MHTHKHILQREEKDFFRLTAFPNCLVFCLLLPLFFRVLFIPRVVRKLFLGKEKCPKFPNSKSSIFWGCGEGMQLVRRLVKYLGELLLTLQCVYKTYQHLVYAQKNLSQLK